jgi:hypothetical protein
MWLANAAYRHIHQFGVITDVATPDRLIQFGTRISF